MADSVEPTNEDNTAEVEAHAASPLELQELPGTEGIISDPVAGSTVSLAACA